MTQKVYRPRPVETWSDLEKEIEKETAWLMNEGEEHDEAKAKATEFIHEKYAELIVNLKATNSFK